MNHPAQKRSPFGQIGVVLAALIAGAVVLLGLQALPSFPDLPFGNDSVDRTGPSLLVSVADLAEFRAASGTFQVVVDLENDTRFVPSLFSGDRTTFLATGTVDAVVDFTSLEDGAVTVSEDGESASFSLPPARLDDADLDLANSRVLSRDRGLLNRVGGLFSDNPTTEREVAALATDRLSEAARDSDLQRRAEANTRDTLTGLARALGYTDVMVRFDGGSEG